MSFDLSDYVDVAERIRIFKAAYPEGSLQSEVEFVEGGVMCQARAYRTPDDTRPGIGHAWEPIPGMTPYTKNSEVMNAETSAWGRAIVALGFETKKIASRQEVQNRSGAEVAPSASAPDNPAEAARQAQATAGKIGSLVIHFGKNKGTPLDVLSDKQLEWYATQWQIQDTPSEYDLGLKEAAVKLLADRRNLVDLPFE